MGRTKRAYNHSQCSVNISSRYYEHCYSENTGQGRFSVPCSDDLGPATSSLCPVLLFAFQPQAPWFPSHVSHLSVLHSCPPYFCRLPRMPWGGGSESPAGHGRHMRALLPAWAGGLLSLPSIPQSRRLERSRQPQNRQLAQ